MRFINQIAEADHLEALRGSTAINSSATAFSRGYTLPPLTRLKTSRRLVHSFQRPRPGPVQFTFKTAATPHRLNRSERRKAAISSCNFSPDRLQGEKSPAQNEHSPHLDVAISQHPHSFPVRCGLP